MYVASLNIDLLFKKVFSNPEIAKSFLQDFLGILITEIIVLNIEYKLSDDAVIVKFDYRCKINGEYVIIEMQQKYKKDVIKRFYLYHCLDTSLQLETLKPIEITRPNGETYKEKDYSGVEPVLTIIWMVDDTLGFEDDFIVFTTLPERAKDFIKDETLWSQSLETILAARAETLQILNNDTKGLGFLQKNKIIYAFQDNIVKN
jgi:PD-(D/E)XK nuclease family transposase